MVALNGPGPTAYIRLVKMVNVNSGETLIVPAVSGAVGSILGPIAKIHGLHVGITSSKEECYWLVNRLGFAGAVSYKSPSFLEDLQAVTPNEIDVYWDNVGGQIVEAALSRAAELGKNTNNSFKSAANFGQIEEAELMALPDIYYNSNPTPPSVDKSQPFLGLITPADMVARGLGSTSSSAQQPLFGGFSGITGQSTAGDRAGLSVENVAAESYGVCFGRKSLPEEEQAE
ncbi:hypothetical protein DL769_010036 [Monosporascus sp. CRB-8-3]|nr:hypothetical protein DL769_010036 [Monosporascus sp. CRB-8-3]